MLKQLRSPLYIALIPALLSIVLSIGAPLNHVFWNVRFKLAEKPASQSTVIVALDDHVGEGDKAEWDSARVAQVVDLVRRQMPQRVFLDSTIKAGENPSGDRALAGAVASLGPDIAFVVRAREPNDFAASNFEMPAPSIAGRAKIAVSGWWVNFLDYGQSAPYSVKIGDRKYPTFSTVLAGVHSGVQNTYTPDYLMSPESVPQISAANLIKGDFAPGLLTGRTVIINGPSNVSPLGYFGHDRIPPIALDLAGAEALRKPVSINLYWAPLLLLTWLFIRAGSRTPRRRWKVLLHGGAVLSVIVLPVAMQLIGVVQEPEAAMLTALLYGAIRLWQKRIRRVQHTSSSGLPNLLALSSTPLDVGRDVIVAVIGRYEEMLATLPKELHGECAKQIARRLSVGSGCNEIYHGDGGHFAWTEEARPIEMQLNHLEGLRALFAAPLQIEAHTFDTNIHFGLDRNEGLDALTRVNSALASANDALSSGRSVELFEADRLAEAPWELSLHARIDEGLRNGDIWLAFQAQWDFSRQRICGAEALIRWNHPTRGPIAPDAFILQAERAGRIDALTYWVVEEAITAALDLNAMGMPIQMSVNLSAQMVDKPNLVGSLVEIVRRRGVDPRLLTIEVTETASVRNRPAAVHNLTQLRALGFRLSIDDFGTGEASLAYLAELPSDELKIDRRFISRLTTHVRERQIVVSTIALAHALGQSVVAEGIEDEATFRLLKELGCDHGQGYYLGRPQAFADFRAAYLKQEERQIGSV